MEGLLAAFHGPKTIEAGLVSAVSDYFPSQRRSSRNQADGKDNAPHDDREQGKGGQTLQHGRTPTLFTWVIVKQFARSSAAWVEILDAKAGAWDRRIMMCLGEDGVSTHHHS